jgi:hypothetical protein
MWYAAAIVSLLVMLTGCAKPQTFEEQKQFMREIAAVAREAGVSVQFQVAYTGRGGLYQQTLWGVDLGVQMQASGQANPGSMRAPESPP